MSAERAASTGHSRTVAASALVAAVVVLALGFSVTSALAGPTTSSTASTSSTTTTEAPTTTTAAPPTTQRTSTTRAQTTTTRAQTTTTAEPTTTEAPTTTAAPTTTQAPTIITPTVTEPTGEGSGGAGLSTDTKLAIVVGGLLAVGGLIGILTFLYWRHTRPPQYLTALDALTGLEASAVPPGTAAVPAGVATVGASTVAGGPATEEIPAVGSADAATRSVRVLDPEPQSSAQVPAGDDVPDSSTPDQPVASDSVGDSTIDDILFGPDPVGEVGSSPPMVTLEDLFGPDHDLKGPPQR